MFVTTQHSIAVANGFFRGLPPIDSGFRVQADACSKAQVSIQQIYCVLFAWPLRKPAGMQSNNEHLGLLRQTPGQQDHCTSPPLTLWLGCRPLKKKHWSPAAQFPIGQSRSSKSPCLCWKGASSGFQALPWFLGPPRFLACVPLTTAAQPSSGSHRQRSCQPSVGEEAPWLLFGDRKSARIITKNSLDAPKRATLPSSHVIFISSPCDGQAMRLVVGPNREYASNQGRTCCPVATCGEGPPVSAPHRAYSVPAHRKPGDVIAPKADRIPQQPHLLPGSTS